MRGGLAETVGSDAGAAVVSPGSADSTAFALVPQIRKHVGSALGPASEAPSGRVRPKGGLKPARPEASGMSTHYFFAGVYQMGEV